MNYDQKCLLDGKLEFYFFKVNNVSKKCYKKYEPLLISIFKGENDPQEIFRAGNPENPFQKNNFSLIRKIYIESDYFYVMVKETDEINKITKIFKDKSVAHPLFPSTYFLLDELINH